MRKKCSRCNEEKELTEFYKDKRASDGASSACKKCLLKQQKKYSIEHKTQREVYIKEYREKHKQKLKEYKANYHLQHKEEQNKKSKEYYYSNKDNIVKNNVEYTKKRCKNDPLYAFILHARGITNHALRKGGGSPRKAEEFLGCSLGYAREHLLKTWFKRYGKEYSGEPYQIDHIVPLSLATTRDDAILLLHYTNIQMLTPEDNIRKGKSLFL